MARRLISTPQSNDPGSEGALGYDYQKELATYLCVKMIADKQVGYVVCEFHEDILQVYNGLQIHLIQVKKNQSKSWTLANITTPAKGEKQSILAKLFSPVQNGKDIARLSFWGHATMSKAQGETQFFLADLVALLKTPENGRDTDWQDSINRYITHLSPDLSKQDIAPETVSKALHMLDIDFSYPHPSAIELECCKKLDEVIRQVWNVDLNSSEIRDIYQNLYSRVKTISAQPKQPWSVKSINREEAVKTAMERVKHYAPAANRVATMNTQDKLTSVGMGGKTLYAFQQRIDAMVLRYEAGMTASDWENYRTEIDCKCQEIRKTFPNCTGAELWQKLRDSFIELGKQWSTGKNDTRINDLFAEGVFFDMTGRCEAQWMRSSYQ